MHCSSTPNGWVVYLLSTSLIISLYHVFGFVVTLSRGKGVLLLLLRGILLSFNTGFCAFNYEDLRPSYSRRLGVVVRAWRFLAVRTTVCVVSSVHWSHVFLYFIKIIQRSLWHYCFWRVLPFLSDRVLRRGRTTMRSWNLRPLRGFSTTSYHHEWITAWSSGRTCLMDWSVYHLLLLSPDVLNYFSLLL